MGSILRGFLGSPKPNMAAVTGSNFLGSSPYNAAKDIGFLGSKLARADIGFFGSKPAIVEKPEVL